MAKGRKEANNPGMKRYTPEVTSLADAINLNNKRGINMSGRGRGRLKEENPTAELAGAIALVAALVVSLFFGQPI